MRKCEFRLRLWIKANQKNKYSGRHKETKWLEGYFHCFFQQGNLEETQGEIDCGMKVEDRKGHIHTIWNDNDVRMRDR